MMFEVTVTAREAQWKYPTRGLKRPVCKVSSRKEAVLSEASSSYGFRILHSQ
jgi:hypothetical protein